MSEAAERNLRKTRQGVVVSDKMDKTIVVSVVDNVKAELDRIEEENEPAAQTLVDRAMFPGSGVAPAEGLHDEQ